MSTRQHSELNATNVCLALACVVLAGGGLLMGVGGATAWLLWAGSLCLAGGLLALAVKLQ